MHERRKGNLGKKREQKATLNNNIYDRQASTSSVVYGFPSLHLTCEYLVTHTIERKKPNVLPVSAQHQHKQSQQAVQKQEESACSFTVKMINAPSINKSARVAASMPRYTVSAAMISLHLLFVRVGGTLRRNSTCATACPSVDLRQ